MGDSASRVPPPPLHRVDPVPAALPGPPPPHRLGLLPLLLFVVAFPTFLAFHQRHPVLYDADAYYHLAVGRTLALDGVPEELPQLRRSVLGEGFGDKELLFHLLLAPFAALPDPVGGGRIVLALLEAALVAMVGALAYRAVGPWGLAIPFWLPYASTELAWRVVRLRPELLSLLLLLAVLWAAGRRRYRLVGVLGVAYTLAYTAFHAFLGLAFLLFAVGVWRRGRWEWRLPVYALLGVGVGLVLHPGFPANLEVWAIQNVSFFLGQGPLDVSSENRPNLTDVALFVNLGWTLGLLLLAAATRRRSAGADDELADAFAVATLVFAPLYLLMSRFSLYALPFATLWLLFELRRRGRRITPWIRLAGRRLPALAAVALCLLVSFPEARRQLATFALRTAPGPGDLRLADRRAVGRALPPGARVAAPWGSTAIYMLWAPQGRYLNVLFPHFMALPYPEVYAAQKALFDGEEPDVPLVAATLLDSDYLAFSTVLESPLLSRRLAADPRVETLYRGINAVYRLRRDANRDFVLDWNVAPAGVRPPPAAALDDWPVYRREVEPRGRAFEGYVDALRMRRPGCVLFARLLWVDAPTEIDYELAPYGPASVRLDDRLVLATGGAPGAVLGGGFDLPLAVGRGIHRLSVESCPAGTPPRNGFYLRRREPPLSGDPPGPRAPRPSSANPP